MTKKKHTETQCTQHFTDSGNCRNRLAMLVFFEYYYLYHLSPYLSLIGFAFETIVHQDKDTYVQAGQYLMHGLGYTFGHRRDDGDTVADHSYGGESNQYLGRH